MSTSRRAAASRNPEYRYLEPVPNTGKWNNRLRWAALIALVLLAVAVFVTGVALAP